IAVAEREDQQAVEEAFSSASAFRDSLPERRRGVIDPLFECYIDVPDHPGIIGRIATELGNERINISNLQIIESREDVPGILRLSFRTQQDLDLAGVRLAAMGFEVHA